MTRRINGLVAAGLVACLGIGFAGCGAGILPTDTLAQAAAKIDFLNQITVGDLAQAFQDFANQTMQFRQSQQTLANLTDEQVQKLQDLQNQLDSGQITPDQFEAGVRDVIGDDAAAMAFVGRRFFGSPFGHHFQGPVSDPLNLTDEQKAQAKAIFEAAHNDIVALREKAHQDILAVLTPEQQAKLEQLRNQGPPVGPPMGMPHGRGPQGRGPHGPMDMRGGRDGGPGDFFARLADELGLTQDQKDQIWAIRDQLRKDVEARHAQARADFIAILTDEQKATLDTIEQQFCQSGHAPEFLQCDTQTAAN